jgi:hypothetical protein
MFQSCVSDQDEKMDQIINDADTEIKKASSEVSKEMLYEVIQKVPSPLEISNLIRESGAAYTEELLNPYEHINNYTNKYSQAVNLGIYGSDLGYINIYAKYQASIIYVSAVQEIAEKLKIGQFFDFVTISRLASNSTDIDSILYISTQGFENMSTYLKQQKRDEISTLVLVGGWVEAVHILSEIAYKFPTNELLERIGEQKILLNDLCLIISMYKGDPYFDRIAKSFDELKKVFDEIEITYIEGDRLMSEIDGVLVVQDNNQSIISITREQSTRIKEEIFKLRKDLIS